MTPTHTSTNQIATTAPSGNVGRHLVHDLVRGGVRPRVLAHRRDGVPAGLDDHVEVVVVDLADASALTTALDGVGALFLTVPALLSEDPLADYEAFGASVARAVEEAGVSHVVLQSSIGAELRRGAGDIDGLARVEELLDATPASTLHLRCGFFFTNLLMQLDALRAGEVPVVLPVDHPFAWVAPADIAAVASSWLLRADWSGRHVQAVHGPADLGWADALAIVSAATGHDVRPRRISDDDMRASLTGAGMGAKQVEAVLGMSTGMRDGFVPEQPRDATTTTPTTLGAWAYEVLRPALSTD
ncbi:NAD(P)H-binding protein [Nocardioides hwasunensis]|uniref:NAD(P)H-binding protein n=1 Tax=Nocardioides hwasunensis TaxID=397258 RepID=A0ABR8ME94_9ACTN|nr:NAD(P)H-binding protein [Nocardioides hwasunensis]MBD3914435.1 NAD(P)H-binding protein [Nocardioides hwasunensis]